MKFFVVILTMIGIESFDNYVGHAMAECLFVYNVFIHRTSLTEFPNNVMEIRPRQLKDGAGKIKYLKDIRQDTDLTFSLILKRDDEVFIEIPNAQRSSFCDPRPHGEVLRGAITPMGERSCPIKKSDYFDVYDLYFITFKNPIQLPCGNFKGIYHVQSGTMNVFKLEFSYTLKPERDDCNNN